MAVCMREWLGRSLGELRFEPLGQRLRASLAGTPLLDTDRGRLVWEPQRLVATYAVPLEDVLVPVVPIGASGSQLPADLPRFLDPRIPFGVHTTAGEQVELRIAEGEDAVVAGFRPDDTDLAGYVVVEFDGPDEWWADGDRVHAHPRDPFHRIDVTAASRPVRIEHDGDLVAVTDDALLLYETSVPVRTYVPVEDVVVPLLPSTTITWCAYKGRATYRSAALPDRVLDDIAWCYEDPAPEVGRIRGRVAFWDERVDVTVGGVTRPRPETPWS